MPRFLLWAGLATAVFAAWPCAAMGGVAESPELGLTVELDIPWAGGTYLPAVVKVTNNKKPYRMDFRLYASSWNVFPAAEKHVSHLSVHVPTGETRLEIPTPGDLDTGEVRVEVFVDGRFVKKLTSTGRASTYMTGTLFILGQGLNELEMSVSDAGLPIQSVRVFPEDAATHWQSYLGNKHILATEGGTIKKLKDPQKRAVVDWVKYGGGVLWLFDSNGMTTAKSLGLPMERVRWSYQKESVDPGTAVFPNGLGYRSVTGMVVISEPATIKSAVAANLEAMAAYTEPISKLFGRAAWETNGWDLPVPLFKKLQKVPKGGYATISAVLALLIGPICLIVLARKKKRVWFYVAAPAIALVGMIGLFVFSILYDGIGLKTNDYAVLLHDQTTGEGAIYRARGFFTGISPRGEPSLSRRAAVVPIMGNGKPRPGTLVTNWTQAQSLEQGWVPSRVPCGLFTASPERIRLGLRVSHENGKATLTNELPRPVKSATVQLEVDGYKRYYRAENVPPGQRVDLSKVSSTTPQPVILSPADIPWNVIAEVDWLPNLDTAFEEAKTLEKQYFYVGFTHKKLEQAAAKETEEDGDG